jgi:hypothetical protein
MEAQVSPPTYALGRSKPRPWLPPVHESDASGFCGETKHLDRSEPSPRAPLAVAAIIVVLGAVVVAFTGPKTPSRAAQAQPPAPAPAFVSAPPGSPLAARALGESFAGGATTTVTATLPSGIELVLPPQEEIAPAAVVAEPAPPETSQATAAATSAPAADAASAAGGKETSSASTTSQPAGPTRELRGSTASVKPATTVRASDRPRAQRARASRSVPRGARRRAAPIPRNPY